MLVNKKGTRTQYAQFLDALYTIELGFRLYYLYYFTSYKIIVPPTNVETCKS